MQTIALRMIRAYQYLSRALWTFRPPILWYSACRFHPTCSEYCHHAILKYGVLRGGMKGAWRVLRCNPLFPGGIDEV